MNNIEHDTSFKETIRVLILVGNSNQYTTLAYKTKDIYGNEIYKGFYYDIWRIIKAKLDYKYNFIEIFLEKKNSNYDEFVNQTHQGIYDIVIGGFYALEDREKKINYTYPLNLNGTSILHIKNYQNYIYELKNVLNKTGIIFLYILIVGILIGIILWFFDNDRTIYLYQVQNSIDKQKAKLIRSIVTGISAVYGEMGFLSENSTSNIKSIILVIIFMTISVFLLMFTQAKITEILINESTSNNIFTIDSLHNKLLLGLKGHAETNKFKHRGAKIDELVNVSREDLIKKYLNNKDKYYGVILSYIDAFGFVKKYPNLGIYNYSGYETASYIVNPSKEEFLRDVNIIILQSRNDLILKDLCDKYFPDTDIFVCSYS